MSLFTALPNNFLRTPRQTTLLLALLAIFCLAFADINIGTSDPWFELYRFGSGFLQASVWSWSELGHSLATTLAFALQGISLAAVLGFIFALLYRFYWIRTLCAFLRAVHELFWALIFIQLFGLSTLTALLAIALPFSGILAKIYGELLEESDRRPQESISTGDENSNNISVFFYARLPLVWRSFCTYTTYRFECAIRSSVILGFVGLPTLGFHLESALGDGHYQQAAALIYCLIIVIFSLRLLMKKILVPFYLLAAIIYLPPSAYFSWSNVERFFTVDIIPAPLRLHNYPIEFSQWCFQLVNEQLLPGLWDTLVLSQVALLLTAVLALILFPLNSALFLGPLTKRLGDSLLIIGRTLPEYLLAFIALLLLGPSMLPAILALALHNGAIIAHLLGIYSESLNLRDDACRGLNRYAYEVLPRLYRQFLALLLYRWEVILRETAILGILGIGTLGFYIDSAFEEFRFDVAFILILTSALLNILADLLARSLRKRLHLKNTADAF